MPRDTAYACSGKHYPLRGKYKHIVKWLDAGHHTAGDPSPGVDAAAVTFTLRCGQARALGEMIRFSVAGKLQPRQRVEGTKVVESKLAKPAVVHRTHDKLCPCWY